MRACRNQIIVLVIILLGGFSYLLDDESDKNHPFRLWIRPFSRRAGMLVLAPFTGDVLPLVGCKACGLDGFQADFLSRFPFDTIRGKVTNQPWALDSTLNSHSCSASPLLPPSICSLTRPRFEPPAVGSCCHPREEAEEA